MSPYLDNKDFVPNFKVIEEDSDITAKQLHIYSIFTEYAWISDTKRQVMCHELCNVCL